MFTRFVQAALLGVGLGSGMVLASSEPAEFSTLTGKLYGTLEVPSGVGPFPVALIIAGSGPTDRDGNSPLLPGKNNSLKLLAEGLAQNGIASLRYDKRLIGQSQTNQKEQDVVFEDFINDAAAWIGYLRKDKRFNKFAVIGHSEGSLIGMVAAQKAGADAYVSVAGPGRSADQILLEQLKPQLSADMFKETERVLAELKAGHSVPIKDIQLPAPIAAALFRDSVQPYMISWLRYNPATEIAKLNIPVLIVQGTTDIQVPLKDADVLAAANPKAKKAVIEGMNHVFKTAPADRQANAATYSNPNLPLAPGFLDAIVSFLR